MELQNIEIFPNRIKVPELVNQWYVFWALLIMAPLKPEGESDPGGFGKN